MSWTYATNDPNGEKIIGMFYEKNWKKNQKEFRTEKLIKRNGYKLYVKLKGYDNSFNRWIDIRRTHYRKQVNIFLNHIITFKEMLKLN